jgi:hypothetical protein
MATADVSPGICGFRTQIEATYDETSGEATITISGECEPGRRLAAELTTVAGYEAAFKPAVENPVYQAAARARLHASCPVPMAIVKAIEIACGTALPRDVEVRLAR